MEIAFKIPVLCEGIFLEAHHRDDWPGSVVFIEPPGPETNKLTTLHVGIARSHAPVSAPSETEGGVVAVVPIDADRSVQLIATYEASAKLRELIRSTFPSIMNSRLIQAPIPKEGTILLHGRTPEDTPWVTVVPYARLDKTGTADIRQPR